MEKLFKVGDIISPKPGRFQNGGKEIIELTDCAYKMRGGFALTYAHAHENYEIRARLKVGDLVKIDYDHLDWHYSWDTQPPTEFDVLEISGFTPRQQAAYFVGHDIAYSYPQSVLIKVEKPEVKVPLPTPRYAKGDTINCTKANGCKIEFVMINPDGVEYGVRECGSEDTFTIKEKEVMVGFRYDLEPEKEETTEFEVGDVVEIAPKWLKLFRAREIGNPFTISRVSPLSTLRSGYHEVEGLLGTKVYVAEEDIKKKVNNEPKESPMLYDIGEEVDLKYSQIHLEIALGNPPYVVKKINRLEKKYKVVGLRYNRWFPEHDLKKKVNNNNTKIDNDEYDTKEEGINLPRKKSYLSRGEIEGRALK